MTGENFEITIELDKLIVTGNGKTRTYYYSTSGKKVKVTKNPNPLNLHGFAEYTHEVDEKNCFFNINEFQYNGRNVITGLTGGCLQKVTAFSVYYWEHGGNPPPKGTPLLIYCRSGNTHHWLKRNTTGGSTWTLASSLSGQPPTKYAEILEELNLLNCNVNGVVQIDVLQRPSDGKYCHGNPGDGHNKRISVEDAGAPYNNGKFKDYNIYQHTPNARDSLIVSAFTSGGIEQTFKPPVTPINNVKEVHVFLSNNFPLLKDIPLLIYFYGTPTPPGTTNNHHWYKNIGGGRWVEVGTLSKVTPNDAAGTSNGKGLLQGVLDGITDSWILNISSGAISFTAATLLCLVLYTFFSVPIPKSISSF